MHSTPRVTRLAGLGLAVAGCVASPSDVAGSTAAPIVVAGATPTVSRETDVDAPVPVPVTDVRAADELPRAVGDVERRHVPGGLVRGGLHHILRAPAISARGRVRRDGRIRPSWDASIRPESAASAAACRRCAPSACGMCVAFCACVAQRKGVAAFDANRAREASHAS